MITAAAVVLVVLLAALAVFQLCLAAGRPWGRLAWGGQHTVLPTGLRIGSAVSVLVYALIAAVVADRAGLVDVVGDDVARVGTWVVVGYFALGVLMNLASRSRAERAVMTPTVVVLLACALVVALAAG
ncbi:hypothetical protein ICW40_15235 [Actinotalea ferrariae]|uniref:hypothetical protein n=1 Tax=Actinotalea ferrariae TaxID=1386098 RepID=UPI001C8B407B|nr:hypothetical protein [Actinotalea ferrariae]MBX9246153.1 hypothetical protein [Actinotalea ferrariae]